MAPGVQRRGAIQMNVPLASVEEHEVTNHAVDEERRVDLWRYDSFISLGFAAEQALTLARSGRADPAPCRRRAALGRPTPPALRFPPWLSPRAGGGPPPDPAAA